MSCSCAALTSHHSLLRVLPHKTFSKSSLISFISYPSSLKSSTSRDFQLLQNRRGISPKSSILDLPLLPFEIDEVLVPSESKKLHLYEARFLSLLEESLAGSKLFVHFVLEPVFTSGFSSEASFTARYGCLVLIENVEQLEIGALVSIRGVGRVNILKLIQVEPYIRGLVIPLKDYVPESMSRINSALLELTNALYSLNNLEIKLKDSKEKTLQTHLRNSVSWAERETVGNSLEGFFPSLAERMSFAALQPVSGSSSSELFNLQKQKLQAMDLKDTAERLANSLNFVKHNLSLVAAKLAIQSLGPL